MGLHPKIFKFLVSSPHRAMRAWSFSGVMSLGMGDPQNGVLEKAIQAHLNKTKQNKDGLDTEL